MLYGIVSYVITCHSVSYHLIVCHNMSECVIDRSLFLSECRSWMQDVTGIQLEDSVDLTASKYEYTGEWLLSVKLGTLRIK